MKNSTALRRTRPQFNGFDGAALKIIAVITMIIDHTGVAIIKHLPGYADTEGMVYAAYWICRLIGRMAFPIYLFLLVEGFGYTRSRAKYALRLFIFCFISELPFDLALYGQTFDWSHQNVFFTLLLGFMVMWGFTLVREKWAKILPELPVKILGIILPSAYFTFRSYKYLTKHTSISVSPYILCALIAIASVFIVVSVIRLALKRGGDREGLIICLDLCVLSLGMLAADLLHTDYNSIGVLAAAVMYLYRYDNTKRIMSGCVVLTALSSAIELTSFADVPLILNYNGKKGPNLKYFFYAVYPVHLLILFGIAKILKL